MFTMGFCETIKHRFQGYLMRPLQPMIDWEEEMVDLLDSFEDFFED